MKKLKTIIEDFLSLDAAKQSKWTAFMIYQVRLYVMIARQLLRDNCLVHAASLSFNTLLSMVPIVALVFALFRSFANLQQYEQDIEDLLQKHLLADSAADAFNKIKELSENISAVDNIVSAFFFLIFSLMLFNTIEVTINYIWKVKQTRSLFDRFITYWILVTLGPILIVVSLQLSQQIEKIAYLGSLITTLMNIFPMAFIAIALIFTYKLVPNTKVQWKAAIIGGVVAGVLFELAKNGFNLYVTRLDYYENIYASLTAAVFFLLWVYVAWVIILFGTEISYTYQNLTYLYQKDLEDKLRLKKITEMSVVNDVLGLRIFWLIAKSYSQDSKIICTSAVAEHFNLSPEIAEEVVRRLEDHNFIVKTSQPADGLVPARSLDNMMIKDIVESFRIDFPPSNPDIPLDGGDYIDQIIQEMEEARLSIINSNSVSQYLTTAKLPEEQDS
ncbi:YihY/virulence factor BrkB family protein [candidate division CSSED10-310 bacterium]|uniref:YihY/virulence factor BrkB family protein n=1 Tax=candidate division CSSED10-310 bacterium TaxID=2855610 RepID=A0ABV6YZ74_UNCC1